MKKKLFQDERVYMNTRVKFLSYTALPEKEVYALFEKGFGKFDYVVKNFSRFDETSHLSKLNKTRNTENKVSNELFKLIEFSINIAKETNGLFDPTIIDILEGYGFDKSYSFPKLTNKKLLQQEIKHLINLRPSFRKIRLDKKKRTIKFVRNQRVDLGAIGKGYAIDLASKVLKPLKNFVIDAGGDIKCEGKNTQNDFWNIGLMDPDNPRGTIGKVKLKNIALACSGPWARRIKFFHHLVNPKTGLPINNIKIAFAVAEKAIVADAYATVIFVSGEKFFKKMEENGIAGFFVNNENKAIMTSNFPEII